LEDEFPMKIGDFQGQTVNLGSKKQHVWIPHGLPLEYRPVGPRPERPQLLSVHGSFDGLARENFMGTAGINTETW